MRQEGHASNRGEIVIDLTEKAVDIIWTRTIILFMKYW